MRCVGRLQWAAALLAAAGAVNLVCAILQGSVAVGIYGAADGYIDGYAESATFIKAYDYIAPVLLFALAVLVFCVALVFRHGVQLQQQADETL